MREKGERKKERCEQDEQETQAVHTQEVFGADRGNPIVAFDHLQTRRGRIEVTPQRDGQSGGERIKSESDSPGMALAHHAQDKSPGDGQQNERCDQVSHA